jgi:hypothetical protein
MYWFSVNVLFCGLAKLQFRVWFFGLSFGLEE